MKYTSLPGANEYHDKMDHYGEPYVGVQPIDTSIHMVEHFVKDEINKKKNCGCPICSRHRLMLRAIQYIIADYKKIKDIKEPLNLGPPPKRPRPPKPHKK